MLPASHRLVDGEEFRRVVRRGRRASASALVVHHAQSTDTRPSQVGFVVSKAVGNAVVRNRVKRRLRHLVRHHLDRLPVGSVLVIRALPSAATATGPELARDLTHCVAAVVPTRSGGLRGARTP